MKRLVLVFAVCELMSLLGGCGIKGPLYMPPDGAKSQFAFSRQNNENNFVQKSYKEATTASVQSKTQS